MGYDEPIGIDLHIHSTASDGTLTPLEILSHAEQLNMGAISITDHDTIDGAVKALESEKSASLKFLTGVEISSKPPFYLPAAGSIHILGYGIQTSNSELKHSLTDLQKARENRNPEILKRLEKCKIAITLNEVRKTVGEGQIGRPHIARVMIEKGIVKNMNEAFDHYLGKNSPAYVDKYRIECEKAIQLIRNAGGIPVLAHPGIIRTKDSNELKNLIFTLKEMGLMGIEVYYPGHTKKQSEKYEQIAHKTDLLLTGGTDFHGMMHPDIQMGSGKGDTFVPFALYEKLMERISSIEPAD